MGCSYLKEQETDYESYIISDRRGMAKKYRPNWKSCV